MAVINNSKYIMLLRGNKGKGREKGKMKKTEGYVVRRLEVNISYFRQEEEPEELNEVISLSERQALFICTRNWAENVDELAQLVAEEYEIELAEVLEDVRNVVLTLQKKGILL